jgi:ribosome biogenesis GTPase
VLVLSKIDLSTETEIHDAIGELEKRDRKVKYILLSNFTLQGLEQVIDFIQKGKTYCVVGSSGVGKSTLINNLFKRQIMKTGDISRSTNKGRHITGHRELFVLENGGIIIDTPGMKELGITDNEEGIRATFEDIYSLSMKCRFSDCKHINESGCAVIEALNNGIIDRDSYNNYLKMYKEQERFQTTVAERRRKEKVFGKLVKNYLKDKDKNNY